MCWTCSLKNHLCSRQLICYWPPWALFETDFTGKRATENVSRQCVCVPETRSSWDFKSILFSPHLKSFTLAGRHFDVLGNKTRKRFVEWGEGKGFPGEWEIRKVGGTLGHLCEGAFLPCSGAGIHPAAVLSKIRLAQGSTKVSWALCSPTLHPLLAAPALLLVLPRCNPVLNTLQMLLDAFLTHFLWSPCNLLCRNNCNLFKCQQATHGGSSCVQEQSNYRERVPSHHLNTDPSQEEGKDHLPLLTAHLPPLPKPPRTLCLCLGPLLGQGLGYKTSSSFGMISTETSAPSAGIQG